MATAVLNQTHLAFKLPGGVEQTRISTGDELITFGRGTNGATAVLLRGVAAGTSNNDAVSKGQMDTADAAVTAAHQAGDASVTSAFSAADAAIIATASAMDTAYKAADVTLTAAVATLTSDLASVDSSSKAADNSITAAYQADDAAIEAAYQAADATLQTNIDAANSAINSEVAARISAVSGEAAARATAIATEQGARSTAVGAAQAAAIAAAEADATTKADAAEASSNTYTDGKVAALASGVSWKNAVRLLANTNVEGTYDSQHNTLTASVNGALSIDSIALDITDRVLLQSQTVATQNGIYDVLNKGDGSNQYVLQRSDDANTSSLMQAAAIFVTEGTYAQQAWVLTTDSVVLNTTDIVFTVFASQGEYTGSAPISISGAKEVSLNDGGVTAAKLADGACTAAKLAAACVDAADKFVAGVVGTAALADDAVTDSKCDFTDVTCATLTASGGVSGQTYTATSDKRLKMNIEDMDSAKADDMVRHFRTCTYKFKTAPGELRHGTIAQDLQLHGMGSFVKEADDGQLSVNYIDYISVLSCSLSSALARLELLESRQ